MPGYLGGLDARPGYLGGECLLNALASFGLLMHLGELFLMPILLSSRLRDIGVHRGGDGTLCVLVSVVLVDAPEAHLGDGLVEWVQVSDC